MSDRFDKLDNPLFKTKSKNAFKPKIKKDERFAISKQFKQKKLDKYG